MVNCPDSVVQPGALSRNDADPDSPLCQPSQAVRVGRRWSRRRFVGWCAGAAAAPVLASCSQESVPRAAKLSPSVLSAAKVAIVACRSYGPQVETSLRRCFDLLGGIGNLVRGKTVTVKANLTTAIQAFPPVLGRPPGETYITHGDTAFALAHILLAEGARRVRFVDSVRFADPMPEVLLLAGWDIRLLMALRGVEFENTRNLGQGRAYAKLPVAGGGYLFSHFELNHSYADTDVFISLARLKHHATTGVTFSMKNLFGTTPNSLYGSNKPDEFSMAGRGELHARAIWTGMVYPGEKRSLVPHDAGYNIPRIVADVCAARPIHVAIIDGIRSLAGGEGPWIRGISAVEPGVLIAGLNPVSTDAVATAVLGYENPRAPKGVAPFRGCDNHLVLAESAGIGTADLQQVDIRGLSIMEALNRPA